MIWGAGFPVPASPLITPTYDGSGQATHPSVIHVPEGFGGYEYWMAFTPYAGSNDDLENPSILASHDGITWRVPNGLINPIDSVHGAAWNADPELELADGVLYCFWRYWDGANGHLMVRTSTDGVHWTPKQLCDTGSGHFWTSPAIVKLGDTWHAWVEGTVATVKRVLYTTAPAITGPWSAVQVCTLGGLPTGREPWHLGVERHLGRWLIVISDTQAGATGTAGRLVLGSSDDGVTFTLSPAIMMPGGSWADFTLYRPTMQIDGDDTHLWFGGNSTAGAWRIGHAVVPTRLFP